MPLTWESIGQRLRKARIELGLTQDEVAEHLQLSRPTMSQIESGKRPVNSIELAKLAGLYRVALVRFLSEDDLSPLDHESLLLRAEEVSSPVKGLLREFLEFCREYAALERMVGRGVPRVPVTYRAEDLGRSPVEQGEELARLERQRLGIGNDPLLNLAEAIELQGVKVIIANVPQASSLAGASITSDTFGPAVLVNVATANGGSMTGGSTVVPGRLNFTAAHEYAHVLVDADRAPIDLDTYLSDPSPFERRANAFAAAFLMPKEGIARELANVGWRPGKEMTPPIALHLAVRFGTSYEATLWRLLNTGVINSDQRERFSTEFAPMRWIQLLGFREVHEDQVQNWQTTTFGIARPSRFKLLVLEAYEKGLISAGRAAKLLDVPRAKFEEIATSYLGSGGDSGEAAQGPEG